MVGVGPRQKHEKKKRIAQHALGGRLGVPTLSIHHPLSPFRSRVCVRGPVNNSPYDPTPAANRHD